MASGAKAVPVCHYEAEHVCCPPNPKLNPNPNSNPNPNPTTNANTNPNPKRNPTPDARQSLSVRTVPWPGLPWQRQ